MQPDRIKHHILKKHKNFVSLFAKLFDAKFVVYFTSAPRYIRQILFRMNESSSNDTI